MWGLESLLASLAPRASSTDPDLLLQRGQLVVDFWIGRLLRVPGQTAATFELRDCLGQRITLPPPPVLLKNQVSTLTFNGAGGLSPGAYQVVVRTGTEVGRRAGLVWR